MYKFRSFLPLLYAINRHFYYIHTLVFWTHNLILAFLSSWSARMRLRGSACCPSLHLSPIATSVYFLKNVPLKIKIFEQG